MDLTIIIFAALALFLSYRLFNVLGTRGGHEPEEHERPVLRPVPAADAAEEPSELEKPALTPREDLPAWAQKAREVLPSFEPKSFLEGASAAYEMIVEAFANGDLRPVAGFVDKAVLDSFSDAIEARESAGYVSFLTFVGIEKPDVKAITIEGDEVRAEIVFRSEQVRATKASDGRVVEGSEDQVVTITDRWTFAKTIRSRDPNWTLVATGA